MSTKYVTSSIIYVKIRKLKNLENEKRFSTKRKNIIHIFQGAYILNITFD